MTPSVVSAGGKVEPPEGSGPGAPNLSQEYTPGRRACPGAHALRCCRHQAWPLYPAVLGEAKERLVHWASRQGFYLDSKQTKAERRGDHKLICPLMSWEPQVSGSSQWGNRQGRMQAPQATFAPKPAPRVPSTVGAPGHDVMAWPLLSEAEENPEHAREGKRDQGDNARAEPPP